MALSDLAVFNEYAYTAMTEVLRQQTDIFNAASGGAIQLQAAQNQGDYTETAFFAKVSGGLVRRRDPNGSGSIAQKNIGMDTSVTVKVASGTPEITFTNQEYGWIQQSPQVAGATIGQQLAKDTLADMLNVSVSAARVVLAAESDVYYDATSNSGSTQDDQKITTHINLNRATAKFGDAANDIVAWVTHSGALHQLHENGLLNAERLFQYGSVNVSRDAFGRLLVISDIPKLFDTDYFSLGLTQGAINIGQNNDFDANQQRINGNENIITSYQAEWTYNLGLKGYAWKKNQNAPTNAQLANANNWQRKATSHKDLPGVVLIAAASN